MISVIFPAFNEAKNIAELHGRIFKAMSDLDHPFEIVAVNDGSTDKTQEELEKLSFLRIIQLAYRSGQTAALDAGIHAARGDIILTLDADLQNDPEDIAKMYIKLQEGYDAVVGWRRERLDTAGRRIYSRLANWLAHKVLGVHFHDYACALKMFKKEFLQGVRLYGEMHVFLGAILYYRGARIAEVSVRHHDRKANLSKHTVFKATKDLADLFTIKFIMRTARPLLLFGGFGLGSWGLAFIFVVWSIILKILEVRDFSQTPLPVIASLFVILGFVSIMTGFLAELVLRSYYEGTNHTVYRIKKIIER